MSLLPNMHSIVPVARLLHAQGFNEYTANLCNKWWWRKKDHTSRKHAENVKKQFSLMVKTKLSEADKALLGRFISLHKNMSFEAGFACGAMTRLHRNTLWHKIRDLFN